MVNAMAVTRSIELRTEGPGPRSREILEHNERVVAEPLAWPSRTRIWTRTATTVAPRRLCRETL